MSEKYNPPLEHLLDLLNFFIVVLKSIQSNSIWIFSKVASNELVVVFHF